MLDALEAASVEIVADCRRGERRLRDIIDLEGRLDHRDVFLSERGAVKDEKFAPAYRARPVEVFADVGRRADPWRRKGIR